MVARRKKSAARRVTTMKPWDPVYANAFGMLETWTAPAEIKVSRGLSGGTMTAQFLDERGDKIEGFIRFKAAGGEWKIVDSGLRLVFKFKLKGAAK